MEFEKLYREIKTCPWCLNKPTLTIKPYPNKVTFDVRLGCNNPNCLFNPNQKLTCSIDELDPCIDEIIDNWNGRTENVVPPSTVDITVDTESKWTLSEALEEVKENEVKCISCVHHIVSENNKHWCKRYACGAWAALIGCQYKGFIDKVEEIKCADCKHYWYCAGEECCNLDELSFPKPCNKFEREDYEKC